MKNRLNLATCGLIACLSVAAHADSAAVDQLLRADRPPDGVVFEIVSGDPAALRWAVPLVSDYSERLRKRFPGLAIAVVSHGKEEFALTRDRRKEYAAVHQEVEKLVRDNAIPVHVCETYANWHKFSAEDFPDYISVTAAGPVQIKNYREIGYQVIKVRKPPSHSPGQAE